MATSTTTFEGPEKKLEIILASKNPSIRADKAAWERVALASGSHIISHLHTTKIDAFLLSESSLFVWDDRVLLITCGKTSLVKAIPEAIKVIGKDNAALVFYERKNLMYPGAQPSNFEEDIEEIADYLPGKSYRLGPANYDHVHVFYSNQPSYTPSEDATFEILMNGITREAEEIFSANRQRNQALSKIESLYSGMETDDYFFTPSGYSMNGVQGENYCTIHVTPQRAGSYASFETNVIENNYDAKIDMLLSVFKPERFSLVLTTSREEKFLQLHDSLYRPTAETKQFPMFCKTEKSFNEFDCGYCVSFLNFVKKD